MFASYDDWWQRVGRWQAKALKHVDGHSGMDMTGGGDLARETYVRDEAITAMLAACPNYDGDFSEFGEEPAQRLIRLGQLPRGFGGFIREEE